MQGILVAAVVIVAAVAGGAWYFFTGPGAEPTVEYNVAVVFSGYITDAWAYEQYRGWKALEDKGIIDKFAFSEAVGAADAERVLRGYIGEGYNIVGTTSGIYGTTSEDIAREFPDVWVVSQNTPFPPADLPNIVTLTFYGQESCYVLGTLARGLTKTNKIGWLCGYFYPDVSREYWGLREAFLKDNPDGELIPVETGMYDIANAKENAIAMIEDGCDIIFVAVATVNGLGVFQAIRERTTSENPIFALTPEPSDGTKIGQDVVLRSAYLEWEPLMTGIIEDIKAGEDITGFRYASLLNGAILLSEYNEAVVEVPAELKTLVEDTKQDILDGTIEVVLNSESPTA